MDWDMLACPWVRERVDEAPHQRIRQRSLVAGKEECQIEDGEVRCGGRRDLEKIPSEEQREASIVPSCDVAAVVH